MGFPGFSWSRSWIIRRAVSWLSATPAPRRCRQASKSESQKACSIAFKGQRGALSLVLCIVSYWASHCFEEVIPISGSAPRWRSKGRIRDLSAWEIQSPGSLPRPRKRLKSGATMRRHSGVFTSTPTGFTSAPLSKRRPTQVLSSQQVPWRVSTLSKVNSGRLLILARKCLGSDPQEWTKGCKGQALSR